MADKSFSTRTSRSYGFAEAMLRNQIWSVSFFYFSMGTNIDPLRLFVIINLNAFPSQTEHLCLPSQTALMDMFDLGGGGIGMDVCVCYWN